MNLEKVTTGKVVIRPTNKKMKQAKRVVQESFNNLKGWNPDEELRELQAVRMLHCKDAFQEAKNAIQLSIEKMKDFCKR